MIEKESKRTKMVPKRRFVYHDRSQCGTSAIHNRSVDKTMKNSSTEFKVGQVGILVPSATIMGVHRRRLFPYGLYISLNVSHFIYTFF